MCSLRAKATLGEPAWTWQPWHKTIRLFHGTLGHNIAGILRHGVLGNVPLSSTAKRNRRRVLWERVKFHARRLNVPLPLPTGAREALAQRIADIADGRGAAYASPWYVRALGHATASLEFDQDVLMAFADQYPWLDWRASLTYFQDGAAQTSGYRQALYAILAEAPQPLAVFHFEVPISVLNHMPVSSGWDWRTGDPCLSNWQIMFEEGLRPEWIHQYDLWDPDLYLDFHFAEKSDRMQLAPAEIVSVRGTPIPVHLPELTNLHNSRCRYR